MRAARLASVLLLVATAAAPALAPSPARADVIGRAFAAAGDPPGGAAAPPAAAPDPTDSPGLAAWAGEAHATSLPELLQVAIRTVPALQSARLDVEIAEARVQATWGRNDWLIGGKLTGSRTTSARQGTTTTIGGSADASRLLPTGGTLALHADTSYSNTADAFTPLLDGTTWSANVDVALTQPLLRGRGRALFDAAEARATLARDAAALGRRLAAIQTVQAAITAYWELVLAERTVAITQSSLELARERLRVTRIGAEGGKTPRSEIPAVLQIIATREEDVLAGELSVLDRSIAVRRAVGLPIGAGALGLRVPADLEPRDEPLALAALVERAYAASPELAQLAKQDASATIDVEVAENGLLPQLDAALSLGPSGSAATFADAWTQVGKLSGVAISGSLTFSRGLAQDDVRGRVREQRATRQRLAVTAVDVRAQLAQGVARAVAQVEVARRRLLLSQRAIELANENIKIETDRFNLGKSTNFDVLNRLEDLRQAELRRTQALIDARKAEVVVQALTGELLPAYGIAVD